MRFKEATMFTVGHSESKACLTKGSIVQQVHMLDAAKVICAVAAVNQKK